MDRIPSGILVDRRIYKLYAKWLEYGVFVKKDMAFIGIRRAEQPTLPFLEIEFLHDPGLDLQGTAVPTRELDQYVDPDIELTIGWIEKAGWVDNEHLMAVLNRVGQ